jgi:hypothetical protein
MMFDENKPRPASPKLSVNDNRCLQKFGDSSFIFHKLLGLLADALCRYVLAATKLHGDDVPIPVSTSSSCYVADHITTLLWRSTLCGAEINDPLSEQSQTPPGLHNSHARLTQETPVRGLIAQRSNLRQRGYSSGDVRIATSGVRNRIDHTGLTASLRARVVRFRRHSVRRSHREERQGAIPEDLCYRSRRRRREQEGLAVPGDGEAVTVLDQDQEPRLHASRRTRGVIRSLAPAKLRNCSVMGRDKSEHEREVFQRFALAAELTVSSIQSCAPPRPDISCSVAGVPHYFELTRMVHSGSSNLMGNHLSQLDRLGSAPALAADA